MHIEGSVRIEGREQGERGNGGEGGEELFAQSPNIVTKENGGKGGTDNPGTMFKNFGKNREGQIRGAKRDGGKNGWFKKENKRKPYPGIYGIRGGGA